MTSTPAPLPPAPEAPAVCVCGAALRETAWGAYLLFDCGSSYSVNAQAWRTPCLAAFHAAAHLREREAVARAWKQKAKQLRAEVKMLRANADLCYCGYCGESDIHQTEVGRHMLTCSKRPEAVLLAKLADCRLELAKLRAEPATAPAVATTSERELTQTAKR